MGFGAMLGIGAGVEESKKNKKVTDEDDTLEEAVLKQQGKRDTETFIQATVGAVKGIAALGIVFGGTVAAFHYKKPVSEFFNNAAQTASDYYNQVEQTVTVVRQTLGL